MARYPMAGHSHIEVDDAAGTPRDLSPWIVEIEPLGRAPGQRKISGEFLCLSYQVMGRVDGPVRFIARFRQTGPVTLGVWP